jgi:hypothetical protein
MGAVLLRVIEGNGLLYMEVTPRFGVSSRV